MKPKPPLAKPLVLGLQAAGHLRYYGRVYWDHPLGKKAWLLLAGDWALEAPWGRARKGK
jgi:hypothetical protein